ncbi:hypothetical protein PQX77_007358 [Marasmius sp. AFHP31]|nr:hypothetical protein PQX77_007358 [Marasmius sp. AFHP31]
MTLISELTELQPLGDLNPNTYQENWLPGFGPNDPGPNDVRRAIVGDVGDQHEAVIDPVLTQPPQIPSPPVPEPPVPTNPPPPQPTPTPIQAGTRKKRARSTNQNDPPAKKSKSAPNSTAAAKPKKKSKRGDLKAAETPSEPPPLCRHNWKEHETTSLFQNLFGPDADRIFQTLLTNPQRVFDEISPLVGGGTFTASACKSKYERSRTIYGWIKEFEKFTGGGGDGDHEDEDGVGVPASYGRRLDGAKKKQFAVGNLTAAVIYQWETNGWTDLWNSRFGKAPNISRVVVRNSDEPVSDWEDEGGSQHALDNGSPPPSTSTPEQARHDSGVNSPAPTAVPPPTPTPKSTSGTVSEPKSTPRRSTSFQESASQSLQNVNKFIDLKTKGEERRLDVIEAQLDLNRKREDRLEREAEARKEIEVRAQKVQMATTVLGNDHVSEEVKVAANKFLMDYFTST